MLGKRRRRCWGRGGGGDGEEVIGGRGDEEDRAMHYVQGELGSQRPDPRWVLTEGTVARGRGLQSRAA